MEPKVKFATTLISGLDRMLSSGNHADVTIVVDGKVFPCHKVRLKKTVITDKVILDPLPINPDQGE